jgi:hypothetical protein
MLARNERNWSNPLSEVIQLRGKRMDWQDKPLRDNQGNELPPLEVVFSTWFNIDQAMEVTGLTRRGVQYACANGLIRAVKIGSVRRGNWYVDPESAEEYSRRKPRGSDEDKKGKNGKG